MINLIQGDCLEVMKDIEDNSIDLILCDLPYDTTRCDWDSLIPLKPLWKEYKRIRKDDHTPIVLFGIMPFICKLWESNPREYKHEWIWEKSRSASAIRAKYTPVRIHENILVFSKKAPRYYPIMEEGKPYTRKARESNVNEHKIGFTGNLNTVNNGTRYPKTIKHFKQNWKRQDQLHPAQKPIELMEYLVQTYSKEGDVVLDNCMGSGSTGVACKNLNRSFIGIELEEKYFEIAKDRINKEDFND